MKKILFPLICILFALSSCGNKPEKSIEEEISSGVVLVQNQSYYEIILSNGQHMYFTSFDESNNKIQGLVTNPDSVSVSTSYGTGFFISEDGKIVTNAHVVSNMIADKSVNKSMRKIIKNMKEYFASMYYEKVSKYEKAQQMYDYANRSSEVSYEDFYKIRDYRDALKEEINELKDVYATLNDIKVSESEVKYHNEVSIAYNNTFVTTTKDFISCVVTKTDSEHDLAVIQLKNKKTPEDNYIFEVPEEDPLENYSFSENLTETFGTDKNSKLCTCSFNMGPALALTKEGVKSQFNTGTISQTTEYRLMYSIPTLPGSSGSPVVNLRGQLVAVNYAGLSTTQNFNYGVRIKYLKNLLERP